MPDTKRFGLQRKIIANMTSAGWRHSPHVSFLYEADVTRMMETLKEINAGRGIGEAITFNTAMLKIIAEGVKACPKMNGHIRYSERLARGSVTTFESVDVTMPVMVDRDTMMTLNVRGMEKKSMTEIRDAVADLIRRARNTDLRQVMYEVAMHDTLKELKRFRIVKVLGRLIGLLLDGGAKLLPNREEKRRFDAIPASERLTWRDLEQGTITVSNPGTLFKRWNGECVLLELVPPQIAAIAVNMVRDRAVVGKDGAVRAAKTAKLTIVFDHRALDGADLVPFIRRVDRIISTPEIFKGLA